MRRIINNILYPIARLYWFIARPKTYGVKCIIRFGQEVLIVQHTYGHRHWTFPGGGIKRRETPEEAVKREVMEEVGIELTNLIPIGDFFTTDEYKRDRVYCFQAEVKDKNFRIRKEEIKEAKWFPIEAMPVNMSQYGKKVWPMGGEGKI